MSETEAHRDPYNDPVYEQYDDPPGELLGYGISEVGVERHTSNEGGNDAVFYGDSDGEWFLIDALKLRNTAYFR